jgi:hypothetical protein
MRSADDFYEAANEHFGWAETARSERERATFMQMAAAWLEVAQTWEMKASVGYTHPRRTLGELRCNAGDVSPTANQI